MADYAKKNLREVDYAAVKHGFSETQIARFAGGDLGCERIGLALEGVKPGRRQAFGHRHEEDEEVYVILDGSGRMRLGEDLIEVGPLDAIRVAPGVMRRATTALQVAAATGAVVDEQVVYDATASLHPDDTKDLLTTALSGEFMKARKILDKMLIDDGLAGEDIIRAIHRAVFDLPVEDRDKVRLVDKLGEIDFRMVEGSTERIQLEALLAHFALVGSESGPKKK